MKAILVGTGGIARELLRRLGESWEVTVVDTSTERLARAEGIRPFRSLQGDGSSRVVLRRAGVEKADALVAATNEDETNLEACRIAMEAGVSRLVAVAADPERLPDYHDLKVTVISPHGLAARRVELSLETRRVSSVAFADGRAEAVEFRVARDSPVRGKALRELHARSWIVGAILRDNRLIVPHGDSVLQPEDLVTVVGAGADFGEMVRTFTAGEAGFPLYYGKRVAIAVDSDADVRDSFAEAIHLARNTRASTVVLVHRDLRSIRDEGRAQRIKGLLEQASSLAEGVEVRRRAVARRPGRSLAPLTAEESVGVIVVRAPRNRGPLGFWMSYRAIGLARRTGRPVLLSRGSYPYRRILVPARRTPAGRAAARVATDLARFSKGELLAAFVADPVFLSGPTDPLEARQAIAWLEEEAAVHGVSVDGVIRRGNPVRTLLRLCEGCDLLVLGIGGPRRRLPLPGIVRIAAHRAPVSVLVVPLQAAGVA